MAEELKKKIKKEGSPASAPDMASVLEAMQQLLAPMQQLLAPLVDFHKELDEAGEDDLRLYWDVRVVRGSGRPFLNTSGTSTLAGALSGSAVRMLTAILQDEVAEKISRPLVAKAQDLIGSVPLDAVEPRMIAPPKDSPAHGRRNEIVDVNEIDESTHIAALMAEADAQLSGEVANAVP